MTELLEEVEEQDECERSGRVEYRAVQLGEVSFPERTVELMVIPYETPTVLNHQGRVIEEIVSRGAFGKIQQRAGGRIKVNRDHDPQRPLGYVKNLYPNRDDGLVAKLFISKTDAGEEALTLADDRVLDCSAGFGLLYGKDGRVRPDAEVWETQNRRRLNHVWLDHVALVSNPAYPTAQVLSVRSDDPVAQPVGSPNLQQLREQELEARYAALDARFSVR
jgi:HK97 family phage prohead protease